VPYRDSIDTCPRCNVALVDARSARGCRDCGGLWVDERVLTEMILAMLPPRPLARLVLAVLDRSDGPLACPTCRRVMEPTAIHEVILDRCPEHGVWFDHDELAIALYRVAEPGREPPLVDLAQRPRPVPGRRSPPRAAPAPRPAPAPVARAPAGVPELGLVVHAPAAAPRELRFRQEIIKLGRMPGLARGHVYIEDPAASRMHAVIEATPDKLLVIDLGSSAGTLVNGAAIHKASLTDGDRIEIGDTVIDVTLATPAR
jgi:Zn-finger nucleic acid-binding protein